MVVIAIQLLNHREVQIVQLGQEKPVSENSRDTIPIRPATNQVLFPRNTLRRFFTAQKGGMSGAPNRLCTFLTEVQSP
jgi:hypothetical protein